MQKRDGRLKKNLWFYSALLIAAYILYRIHVLPYTAVWSNRSEHLYYMSLLAVPLLETWIIERRPVFHLGSVFVRVIGYIAYWYLVIGIRLGVNYVYRNYSESAYWAAQVAGDVIRFISYGLIVYINQIVLTKVKMNQVRLNMGRCACMIILAAAVSLAALICTPNMPSSSLVGDFGIRYGRKFTSLLNYLTSLLYLTACTAIVRSINKCALEP